MSLLQKMGKDGVTADTVAYNAVLNAMANAKQWRAALQLLEEMRTGRHTPAPDVVSFRCLLYAHFFAYSYDLSYISSLQYSNRSLPTTWTLEKGARGDIFNL